MVGDHWSAEYGHLGHQRRENQRGSGKECRLGTCSLRPWFLTFPCCDGNCQLLRTVHKLSSQLQLSPQTAPPKAKGRDGEGLVPTNQSIHLLPAAFLRATVTSAEPAPTARPSAPGFSSLSPCGPSGGTWFSSCHC